MIPGIFNKYLNKLNSHLRIFSNGERAGIYYTDGIQIPEHICGIDIQDIPEFSIYDSKGHILKAGWRRTIQILISKNLINKYKAEKIFSTSFSSYYNTPYKIEKSSIDKAVQECKTNDEFVDVGRMIRKEQGELTCKPKL